MIQLSQGAGEVVAGDVRSAIAAYDTAILASARMCASVVEATQGSSVPAGQSQKLLHSIALGITSVVEGRSGLVDAVRHMVAIKNSSNLVTYDYGCPTGVDQTASAQGEPCKTLEIG